MPRERVWAGGNVDAWEPPASPHPVPGTASTQSLLSSQPRSSSLALSGHQPVSPLTASPGAFSHYFLRNDSSLQWVLFPPRTEPLSARWGGRPRPDSWHSRLVQVETALPSLASLIASQALPRPPLPSPPTYPGLSSVVTSWRRSPLTHHQPSLHAPLSWAPWEIAFVPSVRLGTTSNQLNVPNVQAYPSQHCCPPLVITGLN